MDVAFIGSTAYALVSVVGSRFPADLFACHPGRSGSTASTGRRARPSSRTSAVSLREPAAAFPFVVPTGVQYALEPFRGGFLVTDGHHNRVLYATLDGNVSRDRSSATPSRPGSPSGEHGSTWRKQVRSAPAAERQDCLVRAGIVDRDDVASGARLAVDVERGRGRTLFALSQGEFPCGGDPGCAGSPASHDTGALMKANADGTFTTVADGLDQPSSLEIIGTTAYVVTLGGEIWEIDDTSGAPYGKSR